MFAMFSSLLTPCEPSILWMRLWYPCYSVIHCYCDTLRSGWTFCVFSSSLLSGLLRLREWTLQTRTVERSSGRGDLHEAERSTTVPDKHLLDIAWPILSLDYTTGTSGHPGHLVFWCSLLTGHRNRPEPTTEHVGLIWFVHVDNEGFKRE